jgi:hypothetical protein
MAMLCSTKCSTFTCKVGTHGMAQTFELRQVAPLVFELRSQLFPPRITSWQQLRFHGRECQFSSSIPISDAGSLLHWRDRRKRHLCKHYPVDRSKSVKCVGVCSRTVVKAPLDSRSGAHRPTFLPILVHDGRVVVVDVPPSASDFLQGYPSCE